MGPQYLAIYQSFELLSEFSQEALDQLAASSTLQKFAANAMLLKQGQMNQHLHFLVSGEVGVYVDGLRVSTLKNRGDLLGEMSVINQQPCGASIVAETPCEVLSLDAAALAQSSGVLYRLYAKVLSQKLQVTNQKAKHFEDLSLQLKAAQNELEDIRKQKDQESSFAQEQLLQRLDELYTRNLLPQKTALEADPNWRDALSLLASIHQIHSANAALKRKKVLLAEPNKKQQVIAKMALGGTGVELDVVSTAEEGKVKIENGSYDLLFVESSLWELVNLAHSKMPSADLVLMTSDQIPTYLPNLRQLSSIPNVVSRNEADRTFSIKSILTTVSKLVSGNIFGLEKYLSWGADVQQHAITKSSERPQLIQAMDVYLEKVGVRRSQRDRMRLVLEELLMNAIYDAPVGADGKSMFNHLPRTQEVTLAPAQQGVLRYACDGMFVALSVRDPFGSLRGETILRYLENNYGAEAGELNAKEGKGGAGRGLHLIVQSSDLVVFNLQAGKQSEVIALFNLEVKETEHLNPSFHLFIHS